MEIGIDSFAAFTPKDDSGGLLSGSEAINLLLDRIEFADATGLDVFGMANITARSS